MAKPGVEKWDLDFTVIEKDEHDFPVMKELVSGGSKIRVTDRNKTEYLQKL